MPLVEKEVLIPGLHPMPNGQKFRASRKATRRFFEGLKSLRDAGRDVPVTLEHVEPAADGVLAEGVPLTPVERQEATDRDILKNTAAWTKLDDPRNRISPEGRITLVFDVPDDTEHGKGILDNRYRYVSPAVRRSYIAPDGDEFRAPTMHIALTTDPVQYDQKPGNVALQSLPAGDEVQFSTTSGGFKRIDAVSLSTDDTNKGPNKMADNNKDAGEGAGDGAGLVKSILGKLPEFGLALPADTDDTNFLERLAMALDIRAAMIEGDDADAADSAVIEERPPMAQLSTADVTKLVDRINGAKTSKAYRTRLLTKAGQIDLSTATATKPPAGYVELSAILDDLEAEDAVEFSTGSAQAELKTRIDTLAAAKKIAPAVAENLTQCLERITLSMSGDAARAGLDMVASQLDTLESVDGAISNLLKSETGGYALSTSGEQTHPRGEEFTADGQKNYDNPKEAKAAADAILERIGEK